MNNLPNSRDGLLPSPSFWKEQAARSLLAFTTWTKPDYQAARPHRLLARHLDRLAAGDIKRLMVFMPPRHGKSELVSRRLPAYFLGRRPDKHVIACSYSADLANRMNRDCQRIMDGPAYRALFPDVRLSGSGGRKKKAVRTEAIFDIVGRQGSYRSAGIDGGITGMGFDLGIIDDPFKNFEESHSSIIRDRVDEWYTSTFWTRQAADARILLTMTRWHHDDLAGRLLQRMADDPAADQWTVLRLPALSAASASAASPSAACGLADGAPLWPERFPLDFLKKARAALGSYMFAGMYQQLPTPEGGNHFKEEWFAQRYQDAGAHWQVGSRRFAKAQCPVFATCDPAASERKTADHTAIGVWAVTPANDLLALEIVRGRFGIEAIVPELLKVAQRWEPEWLSVESTGFQVSIVHEARRTPGLPPVREISHEGKGKLVRATPAIILAESGKLWLPPHAPWIKPFIDELVRFTGLNDHEDDQVDVTAYAVWQMPRIMVDTADDVVEHRGEWREEVSQAEAMGLWGRGR